MQDDSRKAVQDKTEKCVYFKTCFWTSVVSRDEVNCLPTIHSHKNRLSMWSKHFQMFYGMEHRVANLEGKKFSPTIAPAFLPGATFQTPVQGRTSIHNIVVSPSSTDRKYTCRFLKGVEFVGQGTREKRIGQKICFRNFIGCLLKFLAKL